MSVPPRSPIRLLAGRDLALGPAAERFLGREYGVNVSFFVNHTPPGHVTGLHVHPYPEVFAIHSGEVEFAERVEMVSIHPAAEMTTEWLEEA